MTTEAPHAQSPAQGAAQSVTRPATWARFLADAESAPAFAARHFPAGTLWSGLSVILIAMAACAALGCRSAAPAPGPSSRRSTGSRSSRTSS